MHSPCRFDNRGAHLNDLLQHGLGYVDEEQGVRAVGRHADKFVRVVVGRHHVQHGIAQLEEDRAIGAGPRHVAADEHVIPAN